MDPSLYESLAFQKLKLWYEPYGPMVFDGHFGISESFAAWKEWGVIACVLYAHFEARLRLERKLWERLFENPVVTRQKIHAAVRAWLKDHDFPGELVGCFD